MNRLSPRTLLRQFYRYLLNRSMTELDENDLKLPAVVFSPHPDDETLGCGGAIICKKREGADVKIVFMCDGSGSHSNLFPAAKLKSIRTSEAIAAAQMLGVEQRDVIFLGFKDKELNKHQGEAVNKVEEIVKRYIPSQIYIPYYRDKLPDHVATNRIVKSVLQTWGVEVIIYEYPVWFWRHWPWVGIPTGNCLQTLFRLKHTLSAGLGLQLLWDFRFCVPIGDILGLKRAALDQHRSQMKRLISDPNWLTLGDVSNGEWLECFFQEYEIFRRYSLGAEQNQDAPQQLR